MIPRHRLTTALTAAALAMSLAAAAEPASSPEGVRPLGVGESIPQLTVNDADGEAFDINAVVAEQPTVLIVYRGGW